MECRYWQGESGALREVAHMPWSLGAMIGVPRSSCQEAAELGNDPLERFPGHANPCLRFPMSQLDAHSAAFPLPPPKLLPGLQSLSDHSPCATPGPWCTIPARSCAASSTCSSHFWSAVMRSTRSQPQPSSWRYPPGSRLRVGLLLRASTHVTGCSPVQVAQSLSWNLVCAHGDP